MAVLDVLAAGINWDKFGGEAIVAVANTTISSGHYKSITVMTGVVLQVSGGPDGSHLFVDDFVLCQGTIKPIYPTIIAGTTPALEWDGATAGANGAAPGGGAAGAATAGTPTLHDVLYNGQYNATASDYRWIHMLRDWGNPGGGGMGWNANTATASVQGGPGGGNLLIVARGAIFIDHNTGGVIDCSGTNGTNGAATAAQGGGGGGGGGVACLISYRRIDCEAGATVNCNGGRGGNGAVGATGRSAGGGGGGGGGFYCLCAPLVNEGLGTLLNAPGVGGAAAAGVGGLVAGGGGGGGSFGAAGAGGNSGVKGGNGGGGGGFVFEGWSPWIGI